MRQQVRSPTFIFFSLYPAWSDEIWGRGKGMDTDVRLLKRKKKHQDPYAALASLYEYEYSRGSQWLSRLNLVVAHDPAYLYQGL